MNARLLRFLAIAIFIALAAPIGHLAAQSRAGSFRGTVTDATAAPIPGASVSLVSADGKALSAETGVSGAFAFSNIAPGKYHLRIASIGFRPIDEAAIEITAGENTRDFQMTVFLATQEVTVEAEALDTVTVESSSNAGQLVLRDEALNTLSDDPDALSDELQALAGPASGPEGGAQIFVDGFSGGRVPPKSSIREVRINRDPYSAEYDRPGFGRIEILTRPGSDRFRGQTFFNFGDESLNSRNPFAVNRAPYQTRMYGGNFGGPLGKKASFFVDVERREIDDNAVVNATTLDALFQPVNVREAYVTPQRRTNANVRLDYQINPANTLVGRFDVLRADARNNGVGQFALPSRAFDSSMNGEIFQLTETATLSASAINETRFEFARFRQAQTALQLAPALNVLDSFQSGGSTQGLSSNKRQGIEFQNMTSIVKGAHTVKFGGRLRGSNLSDVSPDNFLGTFTFTGGLAPVLDALNQPVYGANGQMELAQLTSLERYRRTLWFESLGYSPAQIRALGGGANQFTLNAGAPGATVRQYDLGLFLTHDWRLHPSLTLGFGLRYENQTNIHNASNFAPRASLAWSPDSRNGRAGKTVIRAGAGIFYDRFSDSYTLQSLRFNGSTQQQFIVTNPDFFPTVPSASQLAANAIPQAVYRVAGDLRAPYMFQSSLGVERSLPGHTTLAVNWVRSRSLNALRTRNINAPLPDSGLRPYGTENLFLYEATGRMNQNQLITNLSTRFNSRIMFFGFYAYGHASSDADRGAGLPANQYDLSGEWGRSQMDIRHRAVMGGNVNIPWGFSLNPFVMYRSGMPFDITTGRDNNGDTVFNDRPALATDLARPGVVQTPWGAFDSNPLPGATMIGRNFGEGPGQFTVNLRLSRTWSFGERGGVPPMPGGMPDGAPPPPMGGGGGRMGGGPGPMGGGRGPGGPGGPGPMGGGFGGGSGKYSLQFSVSARNLLNSTSPSNPIGNLSSPLFGQSNGLAGFGPMSGNAGNRVVDLSLRFTF
ncbi:MAG: carboxypeptidase regulatory-like domain-containing protein [Bryobacterales bacterium]|nr:carboxypeptidase regulatory-like domain-containing protein [Bryobacterales bacterium]